MEIKDIYGYKALDEKLYLEVKILCQLDLGLLK